MNRVFIGVDPRQPIAYHVLVSSIQRRSKKPLSITPLILPQLPITRLGLTEFTYSRYIPPYLCGYEGKSLFIDSDMLLLGDINELFEIDRDEAVSVVPFQGDIKYERPSVMLFNNEKCKDLTLDYINGDTTPQLFDWAEEVGALPFQWNHLVGYSSPLPDVKLVHYSQGVPGYKECRDCEYSEEWFREKNIMMDHCSWLEIMGTSKHARPVLDRLSGRA